MAAGDGMDYFFITILLPFFFFYCCRMQAILYGSTEDLGVQRASQIGSVGSSRSFDSLVEPHCAL